MPLILLPKHHTARSLSRCRAAKFSLQADTTSHYYKPITSQTAERPGYRQKPQLLRRCVADYPFEFFEFFSLEIKGFKPVILVKCLAIRKAYIGKIIDLAI